jgi:hypothetical protein
VPELPFGFLNPIWLAFREKVLPGDEIWSFVAERGTDSVAGERRVGYALVRDGKPVSHMTCAIPE